MVVESKMKDSFTSDIVLVFCIWMGNLFMSSPYFHCKMRVWEEKGRKETGVVTPKLYRDKEQPTFCYRRDTLFETGRKILDTQYLACKMFKNLVK